MSGYKLTELGSDLDAILKKAEDSWDASQHPEIYNALDALRMSVAVQEQRGAEIGRLLGVNT